MRRTAVAVISIGCAMGVFAAGGLSPASASAAGRGLVSNHVSKAGSSATRTKSKQASSSPASPASTQAMQTVQYDGYSVTVPSSWRVFHLDTDPGQCVRYDINAVYLGSPGANQNCPSNLMGRAQTITITPAGVSKSGSGGAGTQSAAAQGGLVQSPPPSVAGRRIAARAQAFNQLNQYSQASELRGTVPGANLSVTATYGSDATAVTGYVRNIHRYRQGTPDSTASTASQFSWNRVGDDGGAGTQTSTSRSYFTAPPGHQPAEHLHHDQDHDQDAHRDHHQGAHHRPRPRHRPQPRPKRRARPRPWPARSRPPFRPNRWPDSTPAPRPHRPR